MKKYYWQMSPAEYEEYCRKRNIKNLCMYGWPFFGWCALVAILYVVTHL
ncbi:MAG: hypothetical protein IJZ68_06160 [Bacteroidaceae bacterium]|nr:hypothetical protein [Bacteroidaceae bacterium]